MKQHMTVRRKIILLSCMMVLIATILPGSWFFYEYYHTQIKNASQSVHSLADQMEVTLNKTFDSINNTALSMLASEPIRGWLSGMITFQKGTRQYTEMITEVQNNAKFNVMFSESWLSNCITSAHLQVDNHIVELLPALSSDPIRKRDLEELLEQFQQQRASTVYLTPTQPGQDIVFIKQLRNFNATKSLYLVLGIAQKPFSQILGNTTQELTANISNQEQVVFFSSDPTQVSQVIPPVETDSSFTLFQSKKGDNFGLSLPLQGTDFHMNITVPKHYYIDPMLSTLKWYLFLMLLILLLFVSFTAITLSVHTRFIQNLTEKMNLVRQKDYSARMDAYREKDLNSISLTFNKMTSEMQELIDRVYKKELLLKQAEIARLQAQMNPHFLTNTLATISTMALLNGDPMVYEMVSALNELTTANLCNSKIGTQFVQIREELEYIKKYLFIQQRRFEDKLHYEIDLQSEQLLNYYLPRLIVEPLVENAVVHGIENMTQNSSGRIQISVLETENDIFFVVIDNGCGFDAEKLFQEKTTSQQGHHIGIINIHDRIQLIFGKQYGLYFETAPGQGTRATLHLPLLTHPPELSPVMSSDLARTEDHL